MTTPTQATRPRAVDTNAIRVLWSEFPQVMAMADDLDATRRELAAAIERDGRRVAQAVALLERAETAEAERDAARAALPDAEVARSIAVVLDMNGLGYTADILQRWAERIDDANAGCVSASAPGTVPDIPDFLRRAIDRRAALAGVQS